MLSSFLELGMLYCERNGYPPPTVLAVYRDTGLPGDGLSTSKDPNADCERVFRFDCFLDHRPKRRISGMRWLADASIHLRVRLLPLRPIAWRHAGNPHRRINVAHAAVRAGGPFGHRGATVPDPAMPPGGSAFDAAVSVKLAPLPAI